MHPRLRWVKRSLDEEQLTTPMPILDAHRWDEDEGGEDEDDDEDEIENDLEETEKEEKEGEEEDEENMIQEASDSETKMKTGGGRWMKKQLSHTSSQPTKPSQLPTDNPSRPVYPSTLLLGLLHSGSPEDGRVKVSLGRTLRGPLADYYKVMKDEKNSSLTSPSVPVVRVPRNVMEKEKKRKRRNKWKKKGKRGKYLRGRKNRQG